MSSRGSNQDPERLLHGKYGALIRQANREWESGLDQPAAFRRVAERLAASRSERAVARRWWIGAPLALSALAVVFALSREQSLEVAPELVAESFPPAAVPSPPPSVGTAVVPPPTETTPPRTKDKKEPIVSKRVAAPTTVPAAGSPGEAESTVEAPPPAATTAPVTPEAAAAPDCLSFARHGQTRAAEECFSERANGAGLAAEMALYELARLRRDVLADANGALRALADYRTRFPGGSLRREVEMSQLELLLQLGRSDDALKQSAELLSSSTSGERASELRLLRGHILRKQSRFAEAVREYELAEGAGARGSVAIYFRALCLESAGRPSEAAAAFAKYLEQPQRPHAEDAKRRLEKLKP